MVGRFPRLGQLAVLRWVQPRGRAGKSRPSAIDCIIRHDYAISSWGIDSLTRLHFSELTSCFSFNTLRFKHFRATPRTDIYARLPSSSPPHLIRRRSLLEMPNHQFQWLRVHLPGRRQGMRRRTSSIAIWTGSGGLQDQLVSTERSVRQI